MWHNLETVSLLALELGSILRHLFFRLGLEGLGPNPYQKVVPSRLYMVASGVNGIVLVLHPGGASSLRAQSVIEAELSPLRSVPLLPMQYQMFSVVLAVSGLSSLLSSLQLDPSMCRKCFWMLRHIPIQVGQSFSSCLCGHSGGKSVWV